MTELTDQVRAALSAADLTRYAGPDRSVEELVDEIVGSMVPVIAGWVPDGAAVTAGASKLGGRPDLPAGTEWPCDEDGTPLAFLCQLDLAELAPHDPAGRLPGTGMWWLFSVCDGDTAYGWAIDDDNTAVVWSPEPGPLAPRDFPAGLAAASRLPEQPLVFAPSLVCQESTTYPADYDDDNDPHDADYGLAGRTYYGQRRFDYDIERMIGRALVAAGSHSPRLTVLKDAWFFQPEAATQYDPAAEFELVGFDGALVSEEYGEGEFHIVISRDDLTAGRLGAASVLFEPGT